MVVLPEVLPPAAEDEKQMYILSAASAGFSNGNFATITINDFPVDCGLNDTAHDRGLHIVIINP